MPRLEPDRLFTAVMETGSLAAAARRLGLSSGQASKLLAKLEADLGVRLLNRSTRALSPTEVGQAYYDRIRAILDDLDALDASLRGASAADIVNTADEETLADIFYFYGEERAARRIARAIVAARPIERTAQLASIVRRAVGWRDGQKSDPATRAFQAIRIHINRELEELEDGLIAAERVLKPGGRLAVVTFHSLEDRIVKRFLRDRSGQRPAGSRHLPDVGPSGPEATFEAVAKPVRPGEAELTRNPRARSATLRVARRTAAVFWPDQLRGAA